MNDLESAITQAEIVTTGATKDKDGLKKQAVMLGVNLAKRASVYALDIGNNELHDQLRVSKSTLERRPDTLALSKLIDIHTRLSGIVGVLADYGVSAGELTALKDAIDAYDAVLERPRHLIVERSVQNQVVIPSLLADIREDLYKLDSMMNLFQSHPFAQEYKRARMIIDLGNRKSGGDESAPPVTE